jgi:hypothetical protein
MGKKFYHFVLVVVSVMRNERRGEEAHLEERILKEFFGISLEGE